MNSQTPFQPWETLDMAVIEKAAAALRNGESLVLDAPANLLLLGEYAVTEEGGHGFAVTVEPRASLLIRRRDNAPSPAGELVEIVLLELEKEFPAIRRSILGFGFDLETAGFSTREGRKLGLGSSACATLLFCAGFLLAHSTPSGFNHTEGVLRVCLAAHRRFQGGRGSGYDCYASYHGGAGVFVGGATPTWVAASPPALRFALRSGPEAVSSARAVEGWQAWARKNPGKRETWLKQNREWSAILDKDNAGMVLRDAAAASVQLGKELGVSAECGENAKALGAGNETLLVLDETPGRIHLFSPHGLCAMGAKTARGNGKLLLFGEHSILHGSSAIGLSLDLGTEVSVFEGSSALYGLHPEERDTLEPYLEAIRAIFGEQFPASLRVRSDLPLSGGFGSSAALSVALARALMPQAHEVELWEVANKVDSVFHGKASGIDTGLALRDGAWIFDSHGESLPSIRPLELDSRAHIVYASVPRWRSTGESVATLSARVASGDVEAKAMMRDLSQIITDASGGSVARWPKLVESAHAILARLGLADPVQDQLLAEGRKAGGLAGKLSGAGAGGAFYLLCEDAECAARVADRLGNYARENGVRLAGPFVTEIGR